MEYNPPNTRERIAARRRARQAHPARASAQVRPGPRRALGSWLTSGKLFSLVLFLATMGAFGYLFTAPRFSVRQVAIEGNNLLKPDLITDLARLHGTPIWFVDSAVVAERLLQDAYIERASVRVVLPDQAIISIVERRPEVRWQLGNAQFLVDSNGKVLGLADEIDSDHADDAERPFLVIVDTSPHMLQPNDQVDPDALRLAQALEMRLPAELNFEPPIIGWDFGLGVYVKTDAGQTIVFGQTEDLERKLVILEHLLTEQTAFTYLDLRPSNPFYQNTGATPGTP